MPSAPETIRPQADPDEYPVCPNCGCGLVWEDCERCGGDGWVTVPDEDNGEDDETETCPDCIGAGGWEYCKNC